MDSYLVIYDILLMLVVIVAVAVIVVAESGADKAPAATADTA